MNGNHELLNLDWWRCCDELTITEAVSLILGYDPTPLDIKPDCISPVPVTGYIPLHNAVVAAVRCGVIQGRLDERNVDDSVVEVASLKRWLHDKKIRSEFFNGQEEIPAPETPGYLNPAHPRYSSRLAAAVNAWQALEEAQIRGRSAKQALIDWLTENFEEFKDLKLKNGGGPNRQGIEECAKVANWEASGGAPKTPR